VRLETERLILRPWETRDGENYAALLGDPHVRRFYPRVLSREEAIADLEGGIEKARANGFHFGAAEMRDTGEWVGLLGIGRVPDLTRDAIPTHPDVEIGWVLRPEFWGRGLAPEGAAAWLGYAWDVLDLPEVVAFTAGVNTPSQRVMQKLGMMRDPAADFLHPRIDEGHVLRPHVLYRIENPR
jgi:RimJ/RimL family protein N-acetyltransferase